MEVVVGAQQQPDSEDLTGGRWDFRRDAVHLSSVEQSHRGDEGGEYMRGRWWTFTPVEKKKKEVTAVALRFERDGGAEKEVFVAKAFRTLNLMPVSTNVPAPP